MQHDWFTRTTRLYHLCDNTHSHMHAHDASIYTYTHLHVSFKYACTRLILSIHSMYIYSFICLILMYDVTHSCDAFIGATWLIHTNNATLSYVCVCEYACACVCVYVSVCVCVCVSNTPHSYDQHDPILCATSLIHIYSIPHSYAQHNTFICTTCNMTHDTYTCIFVFTTCGHPIYIYIYIYIYVLYVSCPKSPCKGTDKALHSDRLAPVFHRKRPGFGGACAFKRETWIVCNVFFQKRNLDFVDGDGVEPGF